MSATGSSEGFASAVYFMPGFGLQLGATFLHEKIIGPLRLALLKNSFANFTRQSGHSAGEPFEAFPLQVNTAFLHEKVGGPLGTAQSFCRFCIKLCCNGGEGDQSRGDQSSFHKVPHSIVCSKCALRAQVASLATDLQERRSQQQPAGSREHDRGPWSAKQHFSDFCDSLKDEPKLFQEFHPGGISNWRDGLARRGWDLVAHPARFQEPTGCKGSRRGSSGGSPAFRAGRANSRNCRVILSLNITGQRARRGDNQNHAACQARHRISLHLTSVITGAQAGARGGTGQRPRIRLRQLIHRAVIRGRAYGQASHDT